MTDNLLFDGYNPFTNPDLIIHLLMGGLQRAEQRYHDKLNTIYVNAPQIEQDNSTKTEVVI